MTHSETASRELREGVERARKIEYSVIDTYMREKMAKTSEGSGQRSAKTKG